MLNRKQATFALDSFDHTRDRGGVSVECHFLDVKDKTARYEYIVSISIDVELVEFLYTVKSFDTLGNNPTNTFISVNSRTQFEAYISSLPE